MIYTFGNCTLDVRQLAVQRNGQTTRLRQKALQVCLYLLTHRDRVVSKDELIEEVWPDQFISEATLASTVREVRQATGDSGRAQRIIRAFHGHGYQFVADVVEMPAPSGAADDRAVSTASAGVGDSLSLPVVEPILGTQAAGEYRACPACKHPASTTARFCEACGQRLDEGAAEVSRDAGSKPHCLVGREPELTVLKTWLNRVEQGQGHAVGLTGASGIGKSRLLAAFCEGLHDRQITPLEVHCQPAGSMAPLLPVRTLIQQFCQLAKTDSIEILTGKVSQHLQQAGIPPEERLGGVLHFLGVQPASERMARPRPAMVRAQMQATLRHMLLGRPQPSLLIIIIHNVHEIDTASTRWLTSLAESLTDTSTLLLTTYRAGYQPAWSGSSTAAEIALPPLSPQDSLQVVHAILPPDQLPDSITEEIALQAGGNPLMLDVLTRFVAEHREETAPLTLPSSLQEAVTQRSNRLAAPVRRLLQMAAVLGQEGAVSWLGPLWEGSPGLDTALADACALGFITVQTEAGEPCFRFTHVLIHEGVYASLPPLERQHLHAAAAQALKEQHAAPHESAAHLVAWHDRHSHHAAAAIQSLSHAAEQAAEDFAHADAIRLLQDAQTLVHVLPPTQQVQARLDLQMRQAQSLIAIRRYQEASDLLHLHQPEISLLQDASLTLRHTLLQSRASRGLGAWEQAAQHAQHALEAAATCRDEASMGQACTILAMAAYRAGHPQLGIDHSLQAITWLQAPAAASQRALAHMALGLNALLLGEITTALEAGSQVDTIAAALGDSHLQTYAAWLLGWSHATRGDYEEGIAEGQRSLASATDPLNTAFARGWLGYAYLEQGDPQTAMPHLQQAIDLMNQWNYPCMAGLYTAFWAEAQFAQGQLDRAHGLAHQALTQCQDATYTFGVGWAQRALGRFAQAMDQPMVAKPHLEAALAAFASLPSRFELGRTHLDLASAVQAESRQDAAARHIMDAYQWFETLNVQPYRLRAARLGREIGLALPTHLSV